MTSRVQGDGDGDGGPPESQRAVSSESITAPRFADPRMHPSVQPAIVISATFVAEPIAQSLEFWIERLSVDAQIEFLPYNNVLQALLNGESRFVSNRGGVNAVLLRFEDWARFHPGLELPSSEARARNREIIDAFAAASSRCSSPILVFLCPPAPAVLENGPLSRLFDELETDLTNALASFPGIRVLSTQHVIELMGASAYYDTGTDRVGHIPYTPAAYAALGTAVFRAFHAVQRPPYKVVVVDCDNTLWHGVCGEGGPGAIEIDAPSCAVQQFLKERQQNGMLLCICSKNNVDDVAAVFDARPNMPLKWQDFVASRVNWCAKSENIRSLSKELSLGLDSFIFLDDNPAEAAEVRAHCPEVQAITLPANRDLIRGFLDHLWVFDRSSAASAEDKGRTEMYRQEAKRRAAAGSMSYSSFLAGLELKIDIRELEGAAAVDRAAQMTQRTNQLNFTTRRYTAAQIRDAIGTGAMHAWIAFVSDRYGDYGQVGLMICRIRQDALCLDSFLLSCRALGKGVEHAMMARLGEVAGASSLRSVEIEYIPTARNLPAWDFLNSIGAVPRDAAKDRGFVSRWPAAITANVRYAPPPEGRNDLQTEVSVDLSGPPAASVAAVDYSWVASLCLDARSILLAVQAEAPRTEFVSKVLPGTALERKIAQVWEKALRVSPAGIHDNFFDLGGDSLLAVSVIAELSSSLNCDLPLISLLEAPTIAALAQRLQSCAPEPPRCLVPLKKTGSQLPFYCVHGIGGSILELTDLAGHIHPDQPFFGIQAPGLVDPPPPVQMTVEEMSRRYVREIRVFQPQGPYYLGGSSFGGLVAYEMARQLTDDGQPVALVALFDTSVPALNAQGNSNEWKHRYESFLYRSKLHWGNVLVLDPKKRLRYMKDKIRQSINRPELPQRIRETQQAVQWAASRYTPRKYAGMVTVFRATEQPPWIVADPLLGWGPLAAGGVELYVTPGHHADLVHNPRARVLGQQLHVALVKARRRVIGDAALSN